MVIFAVLKVATLVSLVGHFDYESYVWCYASSLTLHTKVPFRRGENSLLAK